MTKFVLLSEIVVQPNFRFLFSTKLTFSIDLVGSACVCVRATYVVVVVVVVWSANQFSRFHRLSVERSKQLLAYHGFLQKCRKVWLVLVHFENFSLAKYRKF